MTTSVWKALALIGCVTVAGCYSSGQAKDGQSHWQTCTRDSDCDQPEYECVDRQCVAVTDDVEEREPCNEDLTCPADLVCHIDLTCIERGVADEHGLATIAITIPLGLQPDAFYQKGTFVVSDDAVFWQDLGTTNALGDHQGDAGVYRFDVASRVVTSSFSVPGRAYGSLVLDRDILYYADTQGIRWNSLDAVHAGAIGDGTTSDVESPWVVQSGSVYYSRFRGTELRRYTPTTGEDEVVFEVDFGHVIVALAADGDRVFIEAHELDLPSTDLFAINADGSGVELVAHEFRIPETPGRILAKDGLIFTVEGNHNALRAHDIASGEWFTVGEADAPWMELRSVDGDTIYYTLNHLADSEFSHSIVRGTLSGEAATIRESKKDLGAVAAHGGYLYWIEEHWLLRKAL